MTFYDSLFLSFEANLEKCVSKFGKPENVGKHLSKLHFLETGHLTHPSPNAQFR
jgi:hypothetical protein